MYKFDSIKPVLMVGRKQLNSTGTIDVGNTTSTANLNPVDTFGFAGGLLIISIMFDQANAPNVLACRVDEDDVIDADPQAGGYNAVPGCDSLVDAQADGTAATGSGIDTNTDNSVMTFYIPLTPSRKRFFQVRIVNGAASNIGIAANALLLGASLSTSPAESSAFDGEEGSVYRATN